MQASIKEAENRQTLFERGNVEVSIDISVEQCFHGHVTTVTYEQDYVTPTNLVKTRFAEKEIVLNSGIPSGHVMTFKG